MESSGNGFEPTEPVILNEEILISKIHLDFKIKEVRKNINDQDELAWEVEEMKMAIDHIKSNSNCSSCNSVDGLIDKVKLFVDVLMTQINSREEKISLLKEQVSLWEKEQAWLKEVAFKDSLTWVYNRLVMEKILERNILKSKSKKYSFSLWIIDIDFFKKINDTYGHRVWDEVLIDFAKFFEEELDEIENQENVINWKRKSWRRNLIFRYWWEEFVIISSTSKEKLKTFLDWCLLKYSMRMHKFNGDTPFHVTFSWGVTEYEGWWKDTRDSATLVESADVLLYKAKQEWRRKVLIG